MKKILIQLVLGAAIIALGYLCYSSIDTVQQFDNLKKHRYARIVEKLKDIRTAQEGYKSVYNKYADNFDDLINFVKHDSLKVVQAIGSLTDDQLEAGMTEKEAIEKGFILRDTIRKSAITELFPAGYKIDDLRYVPFTNKKHEFKMGATTLYTESGVEIPVFEARVSNTIIFEDVRDDFEYEIQLENTERQRLKKYPGLKVGDIKEANNNIGNWE